MSSIRPSCVLCAGSSGEVWLLDTPRWQAKVQEEDQQMVCAPGDRAQVLCQQR